LYKKSMKVMCILLLTAWLYFPASLLHAETLMVFIGSASKPAMEEIIGLFTKKTGVEVMAHYGGSGEMLSQMLLSGRGDIYMPGSPDFMERAKKAGAVEAGSIRIAAYLIPAINVQKENPKNIQILQDLTREDVRLIIANPKVVCVGLYAVEIFEANGLSAQLRPRITSYTESCARTANTLAMGGADAVIGWRVFQFWNPRRIRTVLLKPEQIRRIAYIPIAVARFARNRELAEKFVHFATSPFAKSILKKHGYILEENEARRYAPDARIGGDYKLPEGW
jgi:molybdate transport system substrate-binding protein